MGVLENVLFVGTVAVVVFGGVVVTYGAWWLLKEWKGRARVREMEKIIAQRGRAYRGSTRVF